GMQPEPPRRDEDAARACSSPVGSCSAGSSIGFGTAFRTRSRFGLDRRTGAGDGRTEAGDVLVGVDADVDQRDAWPTEGVRERRLERGQVVRPAVVELEEGGGAFELDAVGR